MTKPPQASTLVLREDSSSWVGRDRTAPTAQVCDVRMIASREVV